MTFLKKNDRRDSISTMFHRSVSLCEAVTQPGGAPTICGAHSSYEGLSIQALIETAPLSLERTTTIGRNVAMDAVSIASPLAVSNKKRVTFAVPDSMGEDQNSNLPVTPRSSPQRKRRKFQRRNSKTPAMLLVTVTEFQAQQEYQLKHNLRDDDIELAEDLLATMLRNQSHIGNKVGPTRMPWNISLGDSPRKTRLLVSNLPLGGLCRSTS